MNRQKVEEAKGKNRRKGFNTEGTETKSHREHGEEVEELKVEELKKDVPRLRRLGFVVGFVSQP